MKKVFSLCAISCVMMLAFTSCGPTTDDAINYNDAIIDEQANIIQTVDYMYESFKNFESAEMDIAYEAAQNQIDSGTMIVSKMEPFDGSTAFRDSAIALFKLYKSVFDNEIKDMVAIYKLPDDQYTKDEEDKWNQLSEQAVKKMDEGLVRLKAVQSEFAGKHKFEIERGM